MRSPHEIMREQEEIEKVEYVKEQTGRGVFQCRKALRHNGWDVDKAIEWLGQFGDSHLFKCVREIRK